ncbi:sugar transferase [Aerococcus sp. UMB7834]|uniref:sugar transferase n=1 Tax=Aerococcus sp. UMB7834 TaxID=3046342 RepID=UPI00254C30B9|nr:sugar transferase [Aerococcus sp. UMB7834]MDK6805091.1 sugar transferase [Aerococcus sp. UMB7834]
MFYRKYMKRTLDFIIALFALPFWIIIFLIVFLLIKIDDGGPIFYNAERLGKNGKIFKMYKFRSMKVNAPDIRNKDGSTFNAVDDPRLTKVGAILRKTSSDETAQLLNVLVGDMSLVGPRPFLPVKGFTPQGFAKDRLMVRPGLTGYAQAYYRNSINQKRQEEIDSYYANNLNFILDAKIVLKTIKTVLLRENIYHS